MGILITGGTAVGWSAAGTSVFIGWYDLMGRQLTASLCYNFAIHEDTTLIARFSTGVPKPTARLITRPLPAWGGTTAPGDITVDTGSSVQVVASPRVPPLGGVGADLLFVVDRSGSMVDVAAIMSGLAPGLEAQLQASGIGNSLVSNRFGVVTFAGNPPEPELKVSMMASGPFVNAVFAANFNPIGGNEDGYDGIHWALENPAIWREGVAVTKVIVLITDEDRNVHYYSPLGAGNQALQFASLKAELIAKGVVLAVLINAPPGISDRFGNSVLACDHTVNLVRRPNNSEYSNEGASYRQVLPNSYALTQGIDTVSPDGQWPGDKTSNENFPPPVLDPDLATGAQTEYFDLALDQDVRGFFFNLALYRNPAFRESILACIVPVMAERILRLWDARFVGWFDLMGNLLTDQTVYLRTVNEDEVLVARFLSAPPVTPTALLETFAIPGSAGQTTGDGVFPVGTVVEACVEINEGNYPQAYNAKGINRTYLRGTSQAFLSAVLKRALQSGEGGLGISGTSQAYGRALLPKRLEGIARGLAMVQGKARLAFPPVGLDVVLLSPVDGQGPIDGKYYLAPAAITVSALVTLIGRTSLDRVDFYANGEFLGTSGMGEGGIATIGWTGVMGGIYIVYATAVDTGGNEVDSAPVVVTVQASTAPVISKIKDLSVNLGNYSLPERFTICDEVADPSVLQIMTPEVDNAEVMPPESIEIAAPYGIGSTIRTVRFVPGGTAPGVVRVTLVVQQPAEVLTIAGAKGETGYQDAVDPFLALFRYPAGVAEFQRGEIFVVDSGNNAIRLIGSRTGVVTVSSGAGWNAPSGIDTDHEGTAYVADTGNNRIRKVQVEPEYYLERNPSLFNPNGWTPLGVDPVREGGLNVILIPNPGGIAYSRLARVPAPELDIEVAGPDVVVSWTAHVSSWYLHQNPSVVDPNGWVLVDRPVVIVGDRNTVTMPAVSGMVFRLVRILPTYQAPTLSYERDGDLVVSWPVGSGNYFLEGNNSAIDSSGWSPLGIPVVIVGDRNTVTVPEGSPRAYFRLTKVVVPPRLTIRTVGLNLEFSWPLPEAVVTDVEHANITLNSPTGVAIREYETGVELYVADMGSNSIKKIVAGFGTILAGAENGDSGFVDGPSVTARFNIPTALAIGVAGDVFVADTGNGAIRKITVSGNVTTIATGVGTPVGIVVDDRGNCYVSDISGKVIRRVTRDGGISLWAGTEGVGGTVDGYSARLLYPYGLAWNSEGEILVADYSANAIRKVSTRGAPATRSFYVTVEKRTVADYLPPNIRELPLYKKQTGLLDWLIQYSHFDHLLRVENLYNGKAITLDTDYLLRLLNDGTLAVSGISEGNRQALVLLAANIYNLKGTKKGFQYLLSLMNLRAEIHEWYEVNEDPAAFGLDSPLNACSVLLIIKAPVADYLDQAKELEVDALLKAFFWICLTASYSWVRTLEDGFPTESMRDVLEVEKEVSFEDSWSWPDSGSSGMGVGFDDGLTWEDLYPLTVGLGIGTEEAHEGLDEDVDFLMGSDDRVEEVSDFFRVEMDSNDFRSRGFAEEGEQTVTFGQGTYSQKVRMAERIEEAGGIVGFLEGIYEIGPLYEVRVDEGRFSGVFAGGTYEKWVLRERAPIVGSFSLGAHVEVIVSGGNPIESGTLGLEFLNGVYASAVRQNSDTEEVNSEVGFLLGSYALVVGDGGTHLEQVSQGSLYLSGEYSLVTVTAGEYTEVVNASSGFLVGTYENA